MTVHDPAHGECSYNMAEFSKHFTGIALELTSTEKFKKRKAQTRLPLADLWGRMFGLKRNMMQLFALSVILQLFVLASPFYLQIAVDEVLTKFDTDLLLVLALGFACFSLINFITQTIRGYVLLYFGSMLSFQMTSNLFRHLLRLPVDFFEKRHIGDIVSRFGSMEPIRNMLTEGLVTSLIDGLMAITTLILMFVYSPTLAAISLTAFALYFILRMTFYKPFRARQEDLIINKAEENATFIETVRGITSLKLFGAENDRQTLWQNKYANTINSGARFEKLKIWFNAANTGIFGIENILLIYVAARMVLNAEFTIGMIFAFMAYKRNFTDKASALVERAIEFRMLGLHLDRIADIAHSEQEDQSEELTLESQFTSISGQVTVENVKYRYSSDTRDVLKSVSLTIEAGQSVAIIGTSGCGKTTLLKIMTGLFDATDGKILLDEIPVRNYGLSSYRQQIGVVMQEDNLFAGSIAENISFFDPQADMQRIVTAAQMAMIHDEIMVMSMKYESLVGDMGAALSGGQKQRLMLARALYRQPKILFMDEGTAHLDVHTEHLVNVSIAQLGITRIIVAHRLETILMADRVFEMQDGTLHEIEKDKLVELFGSRQQSFAQTSAKGDLNGSGHQTGGTDEPICDNTLISPSPNQL